ncbi:MAG: hypothetical protein PWQ55_949 [Chloroflexota bacterium]|nr:hypothetical protein [Chloroflexota bacterium]
MIEKKFLGLDCLEEQFGSLTLTFTQAVGPRIIALQHKGSQNLLAELPDATLDYPGGGKFHLYGGHRLWVAPEDPALTYLPDDRLVEVKTYPGTVELIQEVEKQTGLRKIIRVQESGYENAVIVDHLVRNEGDTERKLATWAISQMRMGGTGILPLRANSMKGTFLPDRALVLWPYTDLYDARLHVHDEFVFVDTLPLDERRLKVGASNLPQWGAYYNDPYLFIKYSSKADPGCALDLGAEVQCYCDQRFLELETLGLYQTVKPGGTAAHREVWRVVERPFAHLTPAALREFIQQDEMAQIFQGML